MQIELNKLKKRTRRSALALIVVSSSCVFALRNSEARAVDSLPLIGLGIAMGALIANIWFYYFVKKNAITQGNQQQA